MKNLRTSSERIRKVFTNLFDGEKKEDPSIAEKWLDLAEFHMDRLHFTDEEKLDCVHGLLRSEARRWWEIKLDEVQPELLNWQYFVDNFKNDYLG